jgi:hypothetical protein
VTPKQEKSMSGDREFIGRWRAQDIGGACFVTTSLRPSSSPATVAWLEMLG